MRSVKAFLTASAGIVNQITRAVLSLVVRRVFLIYISAEFLGLNTLFGSVIAFLSLSELGVGSAIMMCLYQPLAENNIQKVKAYVNLLRVFNYIMMAVVLVGGIFLIPVVFSTVNGDYSQAVVLKSYILYLVGTALSYLWSYCGTLLSSDQRGYKVVTVYWVCTVIVNVFQIVIIVCWKNYYVYLWTVILYNLISNYIIRTIARKDYPWLSGRADALTINEKKDFIYKLKDIFIYRIATYLIQSLDNIIISVILGTVVVAYYGNYYLIVSMLIAIVGNIGSATIAGLGNVYYSDDKNKLFATTKNLLFIQHMIFSATAIAMLVLSNDFVRVCFGEDSVCSMGVAASLTILYYIQGVTSPLENVRTAVGCYDDKYWQLAVSALNVAISVALTYKIGLSGVVIGTIVCYLVKGFVLTPKVVFGHALPKDYCVGYMKNVCYACISFFLSIAVGILMPAMNGLPFVAVFILKGMLAVGGGTIVNVLVLHRTRLYKENKEYFSDLIKIWLDKLRNR